MKRTIKATISYVNRLRYDEYERLTRSFPLTSKLSRVEFIRLWLALEGFTAIDIARELNIHSSTRLSKTINNAKMKAKTNRETKAYLERWFRL